MCVCVSGNLPESHTGLCNRSLHVFVFGLNGKEKAIFLYMYSLTYLSETITPVNERLAVPSCFNDLGLLRAEIKPRSHECE